jgi:hypothetical protein
MISPGGSSHRIVSPIMDRRDESWCDSALTRRLESARGQGQIVTHKLDVVDFVSEERPRPGFLAPSLGRPTRRQRGGSLRDRAERSPD